jgi:hypothetical protein
MQVMQEVRDELDANPNDYADGKETIISIVEAAEEICSTLPQNGESVPSPTPEETLSPSATPETNGTPRPTPTVAALETLIAQLTPTAGP